MRVRGKSAAISAVAAIVLASVFATSGAEPRPTALAVLTNWDGLALELVRHTATYSPPVAARAFGYIGVAVYEATASGSDHLLTLAGQLNGLTATPQRAAGQTYDDAVIIDAALSFAVAKYFDNTGPTGQRAITAAQAKWDADAAVGVPADVVERSVAYGRAVASHIYDWSQSDGGTVITNMGFPLHYDLAKGADKWVPTSTIGQQQLPLLPDWGNVRPFAMPKGASCALDPPLPYSEDPQSAFYKEAYEVYRTVKNLTPEEKATARFWSDDAMLSTTPPGHWISIGLQLISQAKLSLEDGVDLMARLGIVEGDAFIGCWQAKYQYDLVRPITYIKRLIDPKWDTFLITPPFPEYPSGHSTASGAAATVLTAFFGGNYAFDDATGSRDGLNPRHQSSFWAAAQQAGISRLFGGIHYRTAIVRGLEQGRCIGAFAVALKTRK
jgi:hypothetical protein